MRNWAEATETERHGQSGPPAKILINKPVTNRIGSHFNSGASGDAFSFRFYGHFRCTRFASRSKNESTSDCHKDKWRGRETENDGYSPSDLYRPIGFQCYWKM